MQGITLRGVQFVAAGQARDVEPLVQAIVGVAADGTLQPIVSTSGGIATTPQSTTPNPQNLTTGASVTAPIGASEFSVLLKTGTGTITVGAQSAFNLTIGVPVEFQAPLKAAIVVTLGSPGTADATWSA